MFNPKSNNLLDDQLAFSGLEMNWVGAAIGAGTAIIGGIMGSRSASKKNAAARRAQKKQENLLKNRLKQPTNITLKSLQLLSKTITTIELFNTKLRLKNGSMTSQFKTLNTSMF